MAGFGISACNLDGELYVSGLRGAILRLHKSGFAWEEATQLQQPRFFHQLLPAGNGSALLAVGGASRDGHLASLEFIRVDKAHLGRRTAIPPSRFSF
jgi:hypothetical protein